MTGAVPGLFVLYCLCFSRLRGVILAGVCSGVAISVFMRQYLFPQVDYLDAVIQYTPPIQQKLPHQLLAAFLCCLLASSLVRLVGKSLRPSDFFSIACAAYFGLFIGGYLAGIDRPLTIFVTMVPVYCYFGGLLGSTKSSNIKFIFIQWALVSVFSLVLAAAWNCDSPWCGAYIVLGTTIFCASAWIIDGHNIPEVAPIPDEKVKRQSEQNCAWCTAESAKLQCSNCLRNFASAKDYWIKSVRRSRGRSRIVRGRIFVAVILSLVRPAYEADLLTLLICLIFLSLVSLLGLHEANKFRKLIKSSSKVSADDPRLEWLREHLALYCSAFGVPTPTIHCNRGDFRMGLSIDSLDGEEVLYVPIGFLTLIKKHPKAAEAILAHEVGHVAQADTPLWLYVNIYVKCIHRIFLPISLLFAAAAFAAAIQFNSPLLMFGGLIQPTVLMAFYYSTKSFRRQSEFMADTAASLLVGAPALLEALDVFDRAHATPFSIHPSTQSRQQHINALFPKPKVQEKPPT